MFLPLPVPRDAASAGKEGGWIYVHSSSEGVLVSAHGAF